MHFTRTMPGAFASSASGCQVMLLLAATCQAPAQSAIEAQEIQRKLSEIHSRATTSANIVSSSTKPTTWRTQVNTLMSEVKTAAAAVAQMAAASSTTSIPAGDTAAF